MGRNNNNKETEASEEAPGEGALYPYSVDTCREPRALEAENNEEWPKAVEVEV
tara:strand:- start:235 stop:393 length:159 start_codon:yes stop_codon:yes gene_type:complete